MKNVIKQLDTLVQKWAYKQRSQISGRLGCVAHHIIGRSNKYLRFDKDNLFLCTLEEHTLIHAGKINVNDYLTEKQIETLRQKNIESLLFKPTDDFYRKELLKWKN